MGLLICIDILTSAIIINIINESNVMVTSYTLMLLSELTITITIAFINTIVIIIENVIINVSVNLWKYPLTCYVINLCRTNNITWNKIFNSNSCTVYA